MVKLYLLDKEAIIQANTASSKHVKNADTRRLSAADNLIIAILTN